MAADQSLPENVQLRYGSAKVFAEADTHASEIGELKTGDAYSVVGTDGDFYCVELADGTKGFVYAHNLVGTHMPLTPREQQFADDRVTADAARTAGSWRNKVKRIFGS